MRLLIILSLAFLALYPGTGLAADNATRIILYTLGPVSDEWVEFTVDIVHSAYGYRVDFRGDAALLEAYGPDESDAYFAREILNDMDIIAAVEDTRVLVLTELKLRRAKGFLATCGGLAHSARGTALFSAFNVGKGGADKKTSLSRVAKRIIHETGHASGLHHCKQPLCYMAFFADVAGSDAAHFALCPRCSRLLEENTGISYEIAREHLITKLIIREILDDSRAERVEIPPPPDDLSYDLTGTEIIEDRSDDND